MAVVRLRQNPMAERTFLYGSSLARFFPSPGTNLDAS
jgi:hypothetical protein